MKTQDLIFLKNIPTRLSVDKVFRNRFSPRFFSQDSIPDKDLETIMEAARFTPSSYNLQPWYFYIAKKTALDLKNFPHCFLVLMIGQKKLIY